MNKKHLNLGEEVYFIHKGTWENGYEWRIQKVTIREITLKEGCEGFHCSFNSCGYEYPEYFYSRTIDEAKNKAIAMINEEKEKQITIIKNY